MSVQRIKPENFPKRHLRVSGALPQRGREPPQRPHVETPVPRKPRRPPRLRARSSTYVPTSITALLITQHVYAVGVLLTITLLKL